MFDTIDKPKVDEEDDAAVLQKAARPEVKKKLDELRHKKRQVEALKRKPRAKWTPAQTVDVAYYDSGDLTKHLDELTKQHGYGKLHNTGEFLKPASWDLDRGDVHPAANSCGDVHPVATSVMHTTVNHSDAHAAATSMN